jgi:predicted metal-dependent phosphoesterase TrpH
VTGGRYGPAAWEGIVPPAPSSIDLHTHTRRSDGLLEPSALAAQAAAAGVRLLAITDHDTLAGFRELTGGAGEEAPAGLEIVSGVEINAVAAGINGLWEGELHVLGYGVDPSDEAFETTLAGQRSARRTRFDLAVTRLRELGLAVDAEVAGIDHSRDDALGRPTLARGLVRAGHAATVEDAFERILGLGRPGYVPRQGLGPREAIAAIRAAGGLPVLAHFREAGARPELLRELRAAGLGGLEVHGRTFDTAMVEAMAAIARELRLVPTGGSDFHGDTGTYAEIHAGLWVPPEVGEALRGTLRAR